MTDEIKIRDARPEELDLVEALVREAYEEMRPKLSPGVWQIWSDSLGATIHSGSGEIIVAEGGGELLGAVQFFHDLSSLKKVTWPEGAATVRVLSVRPGARGRGIGRMLMEECIARARGRGIRLFCLVTTGHMVSAKLLYERMGFLPYEDFDASAFLPEERIEAYRMKI